MAILQNYAPAIAGRVQRLKGWHRASLSCLSGIISAFALPPYGLFPLLFLTLPALTLMLDANWARLQAAGFKRLFRSFFATAWWFGLGFFLISLFWIAEAFLIEPERYAWMIPFALLILPGGLALFPAVFVGLAARFWTNDLRRVFVLAIALALSNWMRGHVLTGFPWNVWGYAFAENLTLMQLYSIGGIYAAGLVGLLLFLIPVAFLSASRRSAVAYLIVSGVVWGGMVAYGQHRLSIPQAFDEDIRLVVIQPNVPQAEKWKPENRNRLLPQYLQQTQEALQQTSKAEQTYIFWPESAFPFLLDEQPAALQAIGNTLPPQSTLVTGGIRRKITSENKLFFNSAFVVSSDGEVLASYDKVRLVPFGEYLPGRFLLQSLGVERLVPAPADFTSGLKHTKISLKNSFSFQPLICYEAIFPQTRMHGLDRPNLLVNLTNDGWFGVTSGPYQHLTQARVRAVEQGIPLLRVANTGISSLVDSSGRILAKVVLNKRGSFDSVFPIQSGPTPYVLFGDSIFWGIILSVVSILLVMGALLPTRRD